LRFASVPIFVGVLLLGLYSTVLAYLWFNHLDAQTLGFFMLFNGLGFRYYWKRFNRRGWVGVLVSILVSLVFVFLGALIGGYMGHPLKAGYTRIQPEYALEYIEHTPMFVALKQYDPQVSEQVRKEVIEGSKNKTAHEFGVELGARLQPLVLKALGQTSDSALLQFGKIQLDRFKEVADKGGATDCVLMMTGSVSSGDQATLTRIMSSITPETMKATQDSIAKILEDAARVPSRPKAKDEQRFNALYDQLDTKLKAYGTSAYYFVDDTRTAEERCKSGLSLFKEVLNLPPNDRSFMLRALFQEE